MGEYIKKAVVLFFVYKLRRRAEDEDRHLRSQVAQALREEADALEAILNRIGDQ